MVASIAKKLIFLFLFMGLNKIFLLALFSCSYLFSKLRSCVLACRITWMISGITNQGSGMLLTTFNTAKYFSIIKPIYSLPV